MRGDESAGQLQTPVSRPALHPPCLTHAYVCVCVYVSRPALHEPLRLTHGVPTYSFSTAWASSTIRKSSEGSDWPLSSSIVSICQPANQPSTATPTVSCSTRQGLGLWRSIGAHQVDDERSGAGHAPSGDVGGQNRVEALCELESTRAQGVVHAKWEASPKVGKLG